MQIERHDMPDGSEELRKKIFEAATAGEMQAQMATARRKDLKEPTLRELKQVEFDIDDPCPCGSKKKAKNCCAGRLLRRLRQQRYDAEQREAAARAAGEVSDE